MHEMCRGASLAPIVPLAYTFFARFRVRYWSTRSPVASIGISRLRQDDIPYAADYRQRASSTSSSTCQYLILSVVQAVWGSRTLPISSFIGNVAGSGNPAVTQLPE